MKYQCECLDPECNLTIPAKLWESVYNNLPVKNLSKIYIVNPDCESMKDPRVEVIQKLDACVLVKIRRGSK